MDGTFNMAFEFHRKRCSDNGNILKVLGASMNFAYCLDDFTFIKFAGKTFEMSPIPK